MSHVKAYLEDLAEAGSNLSEVHMCTRFAERILGGLLGYASHDWVINPHADGDDAGGGIPDITVRATLGEECVAWIVIEAKLDDDAIRNEARREKLWADKRKYVGADTTYFVWIAQRTVIVCRPSGDVIQEVYLDNDRLIPPAQTVVCSYEDGPVADALGLVSAEQAAGLGFLEKFREGVLEARHIPVTHETMDTLTETLTGVIASLRAYLTRRWNTLAEQYASFESELAEQTEEFEDLGSLMPERQRALYRRRLESRYREARELLGAAFPEFEYQQAYTEWEPYHEKRGTREDLEDIFRTNTAYVILGRLLFVRLAEDRTDEDGRPLLTRRISNGGLKLWRQLVGAEEPCIGKLVDLAFTQAGSVFEQLFAPTHFDALISLDDPEFDRVLLLVLYRLSAFDFQGLDRDALGDLYQTVLPRELRKKMGEFYTDLEVVEYILHRTGFVEAAQTGAPTLLDPACGSGTFLVRAAYYLIEGALERGVSNEQALALVERSIHGLDINDFAVFLARVNLLFLVFDLVVSTRRDVKFHVHEANSLTRLDLPLQFTTEHGTQRPRIIELKNGERTLEARFDFVVGNPPYVRAERLPDADREIIQRAYQKISHRNVDLAGYFVYRSMDWLTDGGAFGMIVPRAIADAGFAKALREELDRAHITITELTPLDWVCHELFDSDVVPFILIYEGRPKTKGAKVRLVQGIRTKKQLLGECEGGAAPRETEVEWEELTTLAAAGLWPLEVTARDMQVEAALSDLPLLGSAVQTRYGAALRTGCPASDEPQPSYAPLVTGSSIYAYHVDPPHRFAPLEQASDASIWTDAEWRDEEEGFVWSGADAPLPGVMAATAVIGITINAAPFDARTTAALNTVVLSQWREAPAPQHALVALLNSTLLRWYAFVFLRAGVAGGGRRDHHTYPGTLDVLPLFGTPDLKWGEAVADRTIRARALSSRAAILDPEAWATVLEQHDAHSTLSAWPINWQAWPADRALTKSACNLEREREDCLRLSKSLAVTSEKPHLLDFLQVHMPLVIEERQRLTRNEAQGLPAPDEKVIPKLMNQYRDALAARDKHREEYLRLVEEIDEAVFAAYELPSKLEKIVRRRMTEFPLNEYAANYRKPWQPTRRPKIKIFEPGERYH